MTDQNEDFVDIGSALADLLSKVEEPKALTAESMQQIYAYLNDLSIETEGNEQAQIQITQTWEQVKLIAEQNDALAFQVAAAGSVAHAALEEKRAAVDELEGLQNALDEHDEDHPRLNEFADWIREAAQDDFQEYVMDDVWQESMAEAYEEIRDEVQNKIENLTDCGWKEASLFLSVIMGRRASLTPLQAEMFTELMRTFIEQVEEVEAKQNGRR